MREGISCLEAWPNVLCLRTGLDMYARTRQVSRLALPGHLGLDYQAHDHDVASHCIKNIKQ